jgi:hypothetical protein
VIWLNLVRYPALLLFYAGGIGAIASSRYENLAALFYQAKVKENSKEDSTAIGLHHMAALTHDHQKAIPGRDREHTPLSNHVFEVLRDTLRPLVPDDSDYIKYFHFFEIFVGLVFMEAEGIAMGEGGRAWAPVGRYGWEHRQVYPHPFYAENILWSEQERLGAAWPPLRAGMFGGDEARFRVIKKAFAEFIARVRRQGGWC